MTCCDGARRVTRTVTWSRLSVERPFRRRSSRRRHQRLRWHRLESPAGPDSTAGAPDRAHENAGVEPKERIESASVETKMLTTAVYVTPSAPASSSLPTFVEMTIDGGRSDRT